MPPQRHILLKIRVVDELGRPLPGLMDVDVVHRRTRERMHYRGVHATADIRLARGARRRARGYRVTIRPRGGLPPQSQILRVAPNGVAAVLFVYPMRALRRAAEEQGAYLVSGRVSSPGRASVSGLRVVIVDRNPGKDVPVIETITDVRGRYSVGFTAPSPGAAGLEAGSIAQPVVSRKSKPDLQARVFSGDQLVGTSDTRYDAGPDVTLNVTLAADAAGLASEHEALLGAISQSFPGPVGDLKESTDRQDVTYVANKTGWDARAVALAALADQFSRIRGRGRAAAGIGAPFYYALFRAGLPANADTLYHADPRTVQRVWKEAIGKGVIPKSLEQNIPEAVTAFAQLSADNLLTAAPPAAVSPLKDLLEVGQLQPDQQQQFAELYVRSRTDLTKFWDSVTETFGVDVSTRLQVNGKIGFLTRNNAPLVTRLQRIGGDTGLTDPVQLAAAGLHRSSEWLPLLDGAPVPDSIPGNSAEEKRANYAEYLATQIRVSYPTASVAQMVRAADLKADAPAEVHDFLTAHHGKFEIGVQSIEQFIARTGVDIDKGALNDIKRRQRGYQMTPSDQAMSSLLRRGLHSAASVVRYGKDAFVRDFAEDFGGAQRARQTFDKAVQVHAAVLNVALSFLTARNGVALGGDPLEGNPDRRRRGHLRDGQVVTPAPGGNPAKDVIAYPTLEGLFGSMDFCACEECRSILSPAAYLVDLLNFLDQPAAPDGNPQDVLFERRPDLQHLPLTCENTNTALPHIDVVNETLEFFVTNAAEPLSLAGYEGHDTGAALSEDLLASPQFVTDAAYATLVAQRFPLTLPFHKSLEELRRYLVKFEIPLPLAMERLRVKDTLERDGAAYAWRDILMEQAHISRPEHRVFTDSAGVPLWRMYGFPNGTADADVVSGLSNAKDFCRRLMISYEDLANLLRTRFVNPGGVIISKVEKLGVSFGVINALKQGTISPAAFEALLPAGAGAPDPVDYGGQIKTWLTNDDNFARIMGLIVLMDPQGRGDLCNFGILELRHAKPMAAPDDTSTRLSAAEFARILRLVRLWKRTGWTLEQTDALICALFNADLSPDLDVDALAKLDVGFLTLLPRLGIVLRIIDALSLSVNRDLGSVLALWAPIGTFGPNALYRQMFLSPAILKQDPAFDDNGVGEFLVDATEKLLDHAEALRAAFNLTAEEFGRITEALGFDANTPLDIQHVSAVYRRGWLARRLSISVQELLLLIDLTRLHPFAAPDPTAPAVLELADLVNKMKARGMRSSAALYLIWNTDLSGVSAPDPAQVRELARTLRADFVAIDDQFSVVDDPTGDVLRARLALAFGAEAAASFMGLLAEPTDPDALVIDVPYTNPQPWLKPSISDADPGISYDTFRHSLISKGVFTAARRQALRALPAVPAGFKAAVDALFERSQSVLESLFGRYPELKPLYDAYVASPDPLPEKRRRLLAAFRPGLSRLRKRQQALQRLSAAVTVELTFTRRLLDPKEPPFPLHAAGHPARPLLNDIVALQKQGLAAQFFFRNTATGNVDAEDPAAANLDYAPATGNTLPENPGPGSNISGVWHGFLEAPDSGFYNFVIETEAAANAALTLDGKAVPLTQHGRVWRNTDPIELAAGSLSEITFTVQRVKETLAIRWETATRPGEVIPARYIYPPDVLNVFSEAYTRFLKGASLAAALSLTEEELSHLATRHEYEVDGEPWLNALVVTGTPAKPIAAALVKPFNGLLEFARIKEAIAPDDDALLRILRDPAAATAASASLLFAVTRWDPASLTAVVTRFGGTIPDLRRFEFFRRVFDAFDPITTMGIPGAAMIAVTTNDPTPETVRTLQGALRARYAPADWREVVRPVNDELRGLQRDALVAYILHRMAGRPVTDHIDTPDKLFEFFLMDVQMEPCMLTSRIRHALSSVQLFIERCLVNLEPRVSPDALNKDQWEWMKRYRVWEANRKILLFPENWLEPELRDDKSPFFKDLEGELLQGEITEGAAVVAILNYLEKLEGVAKLQPVGVHHVEADPARRTGAIEHVVAATPGSRRRYFYRRREDGSWSPWEQIKLDIEGTPVIPVVWDDRLLLFWLQVMKEAPPTASKPSGDKGLTELRTTDVPGDPPVKTQAILAWSEYYNGKWQPPKTSDVDLPSDIISSTTAFIRRSLTLSVSYDDTTDWLRVAVNYQGNERTSFLLYNTHSTPIRQEDQSLDEGMFAFLLFTPYRGIDPADSESKASLDVTYASVDFTGGTWWPYTYVNRHVLEPDLNVSVITPHHPIEASKRFEAPFFMDDSRHSFFVSTTQEPKWIPDFADVGITVNPGITVDVTIPPIVVQPEEFQFKPKFWGDGGPVGPTGPDPGVESAGLISEFVTQDAYIQQGIGTTGAVIYGGMQIGPSGGFAPVEALGAGVRRRRR
jgi:Neuraminidase-like domain/Salmonella virulence plasmid 28.1kDa A protein